MGNHLTRENEIQTCGSVRYTEIHSKLYEIDENDKRICVKSKRSNKRVLLRFKNKTSRPVIAWWRDFEGFRVCEARIDPFGESKVRTYLDHPWEFTDANTKERYVINNRPFFIPPPEIGGMMFTTTWNITIGMRSLRDTALICLAKSLSSPIAAHYIGLPPKLAKEVEERVTILQRPESPILGKWNESYLTIYRLEDDGEWRGREYRYDDYPEPDQF